MIPASFHIDVLAMAVTGADAARAVRLGILRKPRR
jgi:hypothetical protein